MYDYLVVGAGLWGATFAHCQRQIGRSVLVIDKRTHTGGNCYTEDRDGVNVHVYGPHIFHCSDEFIWEFVNRFATFNSYVNRPKVSFDDRIYSFPINLMTLHQLWGVVTPEEARRKLDEVRVPCENPRNLEEWALSQVGQEIYDKFIYGYTKKQWMRDPSTLPASIIKRLPIRLTYDDNYFNDRYQGIPIGGYTLMINGMLDGCDVELGIDFLADRNTWSRRARKVVFTGKIDEAFGYVYGELEYRTLYFENFSEVGDHQGNAVINYTSESVPYTRITEHKYFQPQQHVEQTIWTREYPTPWTRTSIPYYPIGDEKNMMIYNRYRDLADAQSDMIFGGRLAEYRYYDMHQVIGSALAAARRVCG